MSSYFGQYILTEDCFNGRPSYKNTNGKVLYFDTIYKDWNFGDEYGETNIWSLGNEEAPDKVKSWTLSDELSDSEQHTSISAICIKKGLYISFICLFAINDIL